MLARGARRFVGQMAFQSSSQLQLTAYLTCRPRPPQFVTSIESKLGTGLGIPRIVTITNRHMVQIIHSHDTRNALWLQPNAHEYLPASDAGRVSR